MHRIGNHRTLQKQMTKYFGINAKHCVGIHVSTEFDQIQARYGNVATDHISNTYHSADCNILRDKLGKVYCSKCRNLLENYRRSRKNEKNSPKPKKKTPYNKYTTRQLLESVRHQNQQLIKCNEQLKRYQTLFNKYNNIITILENEIKYEYQGFNNLIRLIIKQHEQLHQYFESNPNSMSFLNDQFKYILHKQSGTLHGMRWSPPSILLGMYIRIHLNVYKLFTESNIIYLPSLRTLDKYRQDWVTGDGMTEKLILLLQSEYKHYAKQRNIKHPPYWVIYVDEMFVQECIWYNPSDATIKGQVSKIHEETCLQSLINLLSKNNNLTPSHVMLQVNFADLRSGFYFEGPFYGSVNGWKGMELCKILIGDVFKKLFDYIPDWKINICFFDCASVNATFISSCMQLTQSKLCDKNILQFINPFSGTKIHAIWCGDHVAKNTRNKIAEGKLKYGDKPIIWNYLRKLVDISSDDVNKSNFATAKKLDRRAVELGSSFDKMRVSYYLNVTSDSTLALLHDKIKTDEDFKDAQPLYEILKHLSGIFNCSVIAPKLNLANQRISNMDHQVFKNQLQHLKYFENGARLNPDNWFPALTLSHLRQFVYTSHSAAKDFFDENKRLGIDGKYLSFFRFTNRRLEGSNGVIRMLRCDKSSSYALGKGLQRFKAHNKYQNQMTNKKFDYYKYKLYLQTRNSP